MKNFLLAAVVCLLAAGLWAYLNSEKEPLKPLPVPHLEPIPADSPALGWDTYRFPQHPELPGGAACDALLHRAGYTLCYAELHEQAYWVAYTLSLSELKNKIKRTDNFRPDKDLPTGSASLADYRRSGFDRGHLAPAADMAWSKQAMDESFYMSNMSPQSPSFNRGMWKKLEEQVRKWALTDTLLYIVTGPILVSGLPSIGSSQVSVPKYYFKVVAHLSLPQIKGIAFIMPNKKLEGSIMDYALPIDSAERRTGIDFFHQLPKALQAPLEAVADPGLWPMP